MSKAALPDSPREWLLCEISVLLLNLDREVSFKLEKLLAVVGLIWCFHLRHYIQLPCSLIITTTHPSNRLLKLKLRVLFGLTLLLSHRRGVCWSDSVTYHTWCSMFLIIAHGRRQHHSIHSHFHLLLIRNCPAAGGLWCSLCIIHRVNICWRVMFTLSNPKQPSPPCYFLQSLIFLALKKCEMWRIRSSWSCCPS